MADPRVGKPLLDSDTAAQGGRSRRLRPGQEGRAGAQAADGTWRVTSYFGLPADFEKISRLVQDLNEAKVDRFVTSNPGAPGPS